MQHESGAAAGSGKQAEKQKDLHSPVIEYDLVGDIPRLRQLEGYDRGDPTGVTVVKRDDLRVSLLVLKAGGRIPPHSASGPVSIQALQGRIAVGFESGEREVAPGTLLCLGARVRHDVHALEDAAILLTVGRTTYEDVSDSHER